MAVMAKDKFLALKKPCNNCPFVVANEFPLRRGRREEIVDSLVRGETFHCHKTVDYDVGENEEPSTTDASRCFGAASVLHKDGYPPMQMERIMERLGGTPADEQALNTAATFDGLEEFVEGVE